jgi:nucleoside-diphosphate-sugar epimerase
MGSLSLQPSPNPLARDLDEILARLDGMLDELKGQRIFITGGTGFFGSWILEILAWANRHLDLQASALILSRDPPTFSTYAPHLAEDPAFRFHAGDVRDFTFPEGRFPYIIHAATTSAEATFRREDPLVTFDILDAGTRRTLDFANRCGAQKLLFTSSGCAYGRQPQELERIPETYMGAPDTLDPASALGEAKRVAELLCASYSHKHGFEAKILRGFSFVGPRLQMDIQYAIGNFIRDAVKGGPIQVRGNGTQIRSYLYAVDLMVWFWTIFLRGKSCSIYNVGSERGVTIAELAGIVSRQIGDSIPVVIAGTPDSGAQRDRYVPDTRRAREELGLKESIDLETAILRTAHFYARQVHP